MSTDFNLSGPVLELTKSGGYYSMYLYDNKTNLENVVKSTFMMKADSEAHYNLLWDELYNERGFNKPRNWEKAIFLMKCNGLKTSPIGILVIDNNLIKDEEDDKFYYEVDIDFIFIRGKYRLNKGYREIFMKVIIDMIFTNLSEINNYSIKSNQLEYWLNASCHSNGCRNFIQSILDNYSLTYEMSDFNFKTKSFMDLVEKDFVLDGIEWE